MKKMTRTWPADLVNHGFQECQEVGWLAGNGHLAGLAEDIYPVRTSADGLKSGHRIGCAGQPEGRESERRDQRGGQVKGERGGHRRVHRVSDWRPELIQQDHAGVRSEHRRWL